MPDIQGMQLELISEKNVKLTKSYHQEGFQTKNRKSSSTEFCEIFGENSFFSSDSQKHHKKLRNHCDTTNFKMDKLLK